jgi:hypothetical protein
MIRTTLYMTRQQHHQIKEAAKRARVSMSEHMRHIIDLTLSTELENPAAQTNSGEFLLGIAKKAKELGTSGPADLSSRVDHYLYGKDFR